VKALVFRHNLAREAAAAIGGRVDRHAFVSRLAPVRIEDVDELPLPAPDWVRVETTFSGLCGSDVKQILLNGSRDNPLTALVSFPHVLGHEVVGRRADTGERVVLNPWLSCGPRGIDPPCQACQAGRYPWCRNFRSGDLPVSIHLGNCATAFGAHAERFAAHPSQLFAIPSGVSDEAAVLADPVSVSLRSILLAPPRDGEPVLVYGSGTLAFAAIALLRHLYPAAQVWAAPRPGARAALATTLGAHAVLSTSPDELVAQVAQAVSTTPLQPWSKRDWLQDGPGVVYDTIGSTETVAAAKPRRSFRSSLPPATSPPMPRSDPTRPPASSPPSPPAAPRPLRIRNSDPRWSQLSLVIRTHRAAQSPPPDRRDLHSKTLQALPAAQYLPAAAPPAARRSPLRIARLAPPRPPANHPLLS
jgi:threonine dehydrogenase-like Zn-dependent dehydrogenase